MGNTSVKTIYSFGTSGYRDDTDEGFNAEVIQQITEAVADYMVTEIEKNGGTVKPIFVGGDTREKTEQFMPQVVEILTSRGLDVFQADSDLPSPVLAYAAKYVGELDPEVRGDYTESLGAILMTASHNPWNYGGYNFLTPDGAVAPTEVSKQFVAFQQAPANKKLDRKGKHVRFNAYEIYKKHLKTRMNIDYAKIKESGLVIYYDPLYATGRQYFPRLLEEEGIDVTMIHGTKERPAGYTGMPEPVGPAMEELKEVVLKEKNDFKVGFGNDGDADRFGVLDEYGKYVIPNDIIALIVDHLIRNKNKKGVIVRSQSSTHLLDAIAKDTGLHVQQTPVGYKYIAEEFIERYGKTPEVLIGGESSGGLSVIDHIPEKDGIVANLLVAELMAYAGKPLSQILDDLRASVPEKFAFRELTITTEAKTEILGYYQGLVMNGGEVAGYTIDQARSADAANALQDTYGTKDGAKMYLNENSWIMVRASGTENYVRVYVEAVDNSIDAAEAKADEMIAKMCDALINQFGVPSEHIVQKI